MRRFASSAVNGEVSEDSTTSIPAHNDDSKNTLPVGAGQWGLIIGIVVGFVVVIVVIVLLYVFRRHSLETNHPKKN
jgi:hypothetical protein